MRRRLPEFAVAAAPALTGIALIGFVALIGAFAGGTWESWSITTTVYIVFVIGLYAFTGTSGVLSFGQMSFGTVGGYLASIATMPAISKGLLLAGLPTFLRTLTLAEVPAALFGALVAAAIAAVLGLALMRLNGIAAGIATLGILVIVQIIFTQYDPLTGGGTLTNIPPTTTVLSGLLWAVGCFALVFFFERSRLGLRLRASREDELAAKAVGVGTSFQRWVAFVLSAFVCGIAGSLYFHYVGALTPTSLYLDYTFLVVAMLVIGGIRSLPGAVAGAVLVSGISEILGRMETGEPIGPITITTKPGLREIVLAIFLLVVLIKAPGGLAEIAWVERLKSRLSARGRRPEQPDPPAADGVPQPTVGTEAAS